MKEWVQGVPIGVGVRTLHNWSLKNVAIRKVEIWRPEPELVSQKKNLSTVPKTQFRDRRTAVAVATIAWPLNRALWLRLLRLLLNTREAGDCTLAAPDSTSTTHCTGLGSWTLPHRLLTYLTIVAHVCNAFPLSEWKPWWGKVPCFLFIFQPVALSRRICSVNTHWCLTIQ